MTCVSGLDQVRRGGQNSDIMHNTRVFLNRVCLQGLNVRFIVGLHVRFIVFTSASLSSRYTHTHIQTYTQTHRHTRTYIHAHTHMHVHRYANYPGSALPLSAHLIRICAHSTPRKLNVSRLILFSFAMQPSVHVSANAFLSLLCGLGACTGASAT